MKKFNYFILISIFSIGIKAQTVPAGENISLDQQLSNINQITVTSGIIYERVVQLSNLYNFNKTTSFNTANFDYFKQCLFEMNSASNGTKFITVDNFKNLVASTTYANEVDVAILNTQFNILNYNEEIPSNGGLNFNTTTNKFEPIAGKAPFGLMHNLVIAPAKNYVSGGNVVYKIRNDLFFKNGTKLIKSIVANFGIGLPIPIMNNKILTNQNITINYTSSGEKKITFVVTFVDNSTMTTYGKIYFDYIDPLTKASCLVGNGIKEDFEIIADEPFTGYKVGDPKIKSKIQCRVFYSDGNVTAKIMKPIIILDGFDPGDKRKFEDCDCENDPDCACRCVTNGVFDAEKHRSMTDLMKYYDPATIDFKFLTTKLRSLGYDLILVNHPNYETTNLINGQTVKIDGGAYYIESNAMALMKLIQYVNGKLSTNNSTNKIAIVGPSMGGQISRYALAFMEKKYAQTSDLKYLHNTYLWISVDSPHLGANIPMGDQALLNLVKNASDGAKEFYEKSLASPAAQQQLIEFHREGTSYNVVDLSYLNAQTTSQLLPLNRGNSYFQQHYNNQSINGIINSNGWPMNLRKIALVNGSLSGSKESQALDGSPIMNFANDSQKVLNIRGFQRFNFNFGFGSITTRVHIASLEANFMPTYGTNQQIARFKKSFTDKTTQSLNINSRGNMDNVPGGYFAAQQDISSSTLVSNPIAGTNLTNSLNWSLNDFSLENFIKTLSTHFGGSEWQLRDYNPIHSFIPTFSALAINQPNQSWANPLNFNLLCPSNRLTPFDSYYGESKNSQHTSFTKASVDWLLKELDKNPQVPNFPIQENILNGVEFICANQATTLSIDEPCKLPSKVYNWSVQGNLQIVSFTDYSVTVKGTSNVGTLSKVIGTFQNGQKIEKIIHVGSPIFPAESYINGPIDVGLNQALTYNYVGAMPTGSSTIQWFIDGPPVDDNGLATCFWQILSGQNTSTITVKSDCVATTAVIGVKASNVCGTSQKYTYVSASSTGNGNPCNPIIIASPNPATSGTGLNVNVVTPNPCGGIVPLGSRNEIKNEVKIYDLFGRILYNETFKDNKIFLNGLNFNKGHYILNVLTNNGIMLKEIIIFE